MKVLLVRAEGTPDADQRELAALGLDVTAEPFIEVAPCADPDAPERARALLQAAAAPDAWVILTSAAGVRALVALLGVDAVRHGLVRAQAQGARFAAVGPTSAGALTDLGARDVLAPASAHTAAALLEVLRAVAPATAVLPRSSIGDSLLPLTLEARGWTLVSQVLYETTTVRSVPPAAPRLRAGEFDALVLRSPSAARAAAQLAGPIPTSTRVIAGGPTTALAAQRLGITVCTITRDSQATSIADAVCEALALGDHPSQVEAHA